MDACDPGVNSQNLKTFLKQNTGIDLKLSRSEICDVYSSIQDGKLPLPPLVLSRDRSYMLDRKSPLTMTDFDKLFSSSTKVTSIRRIAKKVGVARHADKKLTKAQLISIIGRRLHALKIHEPIKFHSTQKTKITRESNLGFVNNANLRNEVNGGANLRNEVNGTNLRNEVNGTNLRNEVNGTNLRNDAVNEVNSRKRVSFGGLRRKTFSRNNKNNNNLSPYSMSEKVVKVQKNKKISNLSRIIFGLSRSKNNTNRNKNNNKNVYELAKKRRFFQMGKDRAKKYLRNMGVLNMTNSQFNDEWERLYKELYPKTFESESKIPFRNSIKRRGFNRPTFLSPRKTPLTPKTGRTNVSETNVKQIQSNFNKRMEQEEFELQLKKLTNLLNSSKKLNNNTKQKFLQNFKTTKNFNRVRKNIEERLNMSNTPQPNTPRSNVPQPNTPRSNAPQPNTPQPNTPRSNVPQPNTPQPNATQQKLLSKILNNSKNMTNENKVQFLRRFNNGENFNTIKANAIRKAQNLKRNRLQKEKNQENKRIRNEQQKLLSKILNNSKNMTNENKVQFLRRFNNGENFNTIKANAIRKAQELAKQRKAKEEEERKARERENQQQLLSKILNNSKNLTNANKATFLKRFANGGDFNTIKSNAISKAQELAKQRKAKEEANRLAKEEEERKAREKEEANRLAKEEEERKAREREKQQQLLSKILNNSKNLTNANKATFLKRFEKGETFNTVKKNAISKAQELAKQRKAKEEEDRKAREKKEANRKAREKEEANRKAKEEMIEKKKAEALAKKKKEEEEKKKKETENKKKAAQNTQMRSSLTKKVKSTQMDQKVKNKLLNQLKNYSIQIKNIAPSIEKTIESEKLNGNYNEAANRKKRQEVKKQLAEYISKTYPNMTKADRKKYINSANLTQWRKGMFTGSQGMEANKAFNRIKGNIKRNMDEKKRKNVQAKLIKAMQNKPPPPPKNKKANLKKLVNNTMKGRAAKNVSRLKKNINEGISEIAVKTRLAQLNKQTKYQKK